jgi:hypothetical protein
MSPDLIDVNSYVIQKDISKIKVWDKVEIKINSFEWESFSWVVEEIDSIPKIVNGISKFKVNVSLLDNKEFNIFSSMKSEIKITINKIPKWLVVPYLSVNIEKDTEKSYVYVLTDDWKKEKRYVKLWLTNWEFYQVLDWIKKDEMVLELNYDPTVFEDAYSRDGMYGGYDWSEGWYVVD